MKISERRMSEINFRKSEIKKNALELILKNNFYNTSIQKIAEKSGLGKGTVYYYYKNKEEIFLDILIEIIINEKKEINKLLDKESTLLDFLQSVSNMSLVSVMKHLHIISTFQREMNNLCDKNKGDFFEKLIQNLIMVRKLLLRTVSVKLINENISVDADLLVDMISSQIIGFAHRSKHIENKEQVIKNLEDAINIIYNGIKVKKIKETT